MQMGTEHHAKQVSEQAGGATGPTRLNGRHEREEESSKQVFTPDHK